MTVGETRKNFLICLVLGVAVVFVYWPARQYDFVEYDDGVYVFNNPEVRRGLSWWGLVWSFVDAHASNFHPLTWLSHMLDCQLFGLNPGAHHLVNVFLHAANAALVFLLLRSLTGLASRSAVTAALFALHPLRVESVAWISERKDVLSGFFFLLTLWAYVEFAKTRRVVGEIQMDRPRVFDFFYSKYYRWSLVLFLFGLLSKPMLVTIPALLLLLDFWPLKRLDSVSKTERRFCGIPHRLWLEKIPFVVGSLIFSVLTMLAQGSSGAVKSTSLATKLGNTICAYASYLPKIFWPRDLSVIYLRSERFSEALIIAGLAVLLAITGLAWLTIRRRPYVLVGWSWFVVMLLPVSGLVTIGDLFMADRYTYLPSIGLTLLCVWGWCDLTGGHFRERTFRTIASAVAILVLVACVVASRNQLRYWKNTETLMQHVLALDPRNFVAHINLGVYYGKIGNLDTALFHRQRARELKPRPERKDSL